MTSVVALGGLVPQAISLMSLIPLLAVGLTYFRYQTADPESYPIDVPQVLTVKYHIKNNTN
jgi:hypothetical protein